MAAVTLKEAFTRIPSDATAREAVDILTAAIKDLYERYQVIETVRIDPIQRATACFVAISFARKEVWFVGDCQCLLNQERILNEKQIDTIASNARSMFLEAEIAQGKTIEELLQHDTRRAFILPLLERQMLFQNNPAAGQYWFSIIDGFEVSDEGIRIHPLPADIQTIVLASDGLIGMAIDYRIRYAFEMTPSRRLVAWKGALLLVTKRREHEDDPLFDWDWVPAGMALPLPGGVSSNPSEVARGPYSLALLQAFFDRLDVTVHALRPVGRLLNEDEEHLLGQYCLVLSLFEQVFRSGIQRGHSSNRL